MLEVEAECLLKSSCQNVYIHSGAVCTQAKWGQGRGVREKAKQILVFEYILNSNEALEKNLFKLSGRLIDECLG